MGSLCVEYCSQNQSGPCWAHCLNPDTGHPWRLAEAFMYSSGPGDFHWRSCDYTQPWSPKCERQVGFCFPYFPLQVTVIPGVTRSVLPVYQGIFDATSLSPRSFLTLRCHWGLVFCRTLLAKGMLLLLDHCRLSVFSWSSWALSGSLQICPQYWLPLQAGAVVSSHPTVLHSFLIPCLHSCWMYHVRRSLTTDWGVFSFLPGLWEKLAANTPSLVPS